MQADWQAGRLTGRQAHRQAVGQACMEAGRQAGRLAHRQGGRQAGRHAGTQAGRWADMQTGRRADMRADTEAGRQTGRQPAIHETSPSHRPFTLILFLTFPLASFAHYPSHFHPFPLQACCEIMTHRLDPQIDAKFDS